MIGMPHIRKVHFLLGAAGAVAVAAGTYAAGPFSIVAIRVTGSRVAGINGSFKLLNASVGHPGIPSNGTGGACIAFRAQDLGFDVMASKSCHSNADCSNPDPSATPGTEAAGVFTPDATRPAHFEHRFGYCDTATNQCWAKPVYTGGNYTKTDSVGADTALCTRRIVALGDPPWVAGPDNKISATLIPIGGFGLNSGPIEARVVACLQQTGATRATGCSSVTGPARMEVLGKARAL